MINIQLPRKWAIYFLKQIKERKLNMLRKGDINGRNF